MKLTLKNIVSVLFLVTSSVQAVRLEVKSSSLWTKFRRWVRCTFSSAFFALASLVPGRGQAVRLEVTDVQDENTLYFKQGNDPREERNLPEGVLTCRTLIVEDLRGGDTYWLEVLENLTFGKLSFSSITFLPPALGSEQRVRDLLSFVPSQCQMEITNSVEEELLENTGKRGVNFSASFWPDLFAKNADINIRDVSVNLKNFFDGYGGNNLISFIDCDFSGAKPPACLLMDGFKRSHQGTINFIGFRPEELPFSLQTDFFPLKRKYYVPSKGGEKPKKGVVEKKFDVPSDVTISLLEMDSNKNIPKDTFMRLDFSGGKIYLASDILLNMVASELSSLQIGNMKDLAKTFVKRFDIPQAKVLSFIDKLKNTVKPEVLRDLPDCWTKELNAVKDIKKEEVSLSKSKESKDLDDRRSMYSTAKDVHPLKNKEESDDSQNV
jgi:hypothetical protein